jgi:hypothetical protein
MPRDTEGTFVATIIVDSKAIGGDVTILVEGRTYRVSGRLKRGLRAMAAEIADGKDEASIRYNKFLNETRFRPWET